MPFCMNDILHYPTMLTGHLWGRKCFYLRIGINRTYFLDTSIFSRRVRSFFTSYRFPILSPNSMTRFFHFLLFSLFLVHCSYPLTSPVLYHPHVSTTTNLPVIATMQYAPIHRFPAAITFLSLRHRPLSPMTCLALLKLIEKISW